MGHDVLAGLFEQMAHDEALLRSRASRVEQEMS
jgi:hypothetical protein